MDWGFIRLIRAAILCGFSVWVSAASLGAAAVEEGEPAPALPGQQIGDESLEPFDPLVPSAPEPAKEGELLFF